MIAVITPFILVLMLAMSDASYAGEKELKRSDIPEAVIKAFEAANPNIPVTEFNRETMDGQTVYEIETRVGKFEKDFIYSENGTLLQIEEDISSKSLPEVIVNSIRSSYPNCEFEKADRITKGSEFVYEVMIEIEEGSSETMYMLTVSADGGILTSTEIDDDSDDAGDFDDDD